jgi:hypothetical protein
MLENTISEHVGDTCAITLPIPTVDGRIVGVFIEQRLVDFFLVNDGGKAVNELILQGIKITDSIKVYLESLGQHFGVSYADEMFQCAGKRDELQKMILAVGACSSLAMAQLIGNISVPSEEPVREQFGRALRSWAKKKFTVSCDVAVKGKHANHKFDFVAAAIQRPSNVIMMSVLSPGSNPLAAAQRFGFKTTDLDGTQFGKRPKVAVQARAELWTPDARSIIRSCADLVIEIGSDEKIDARLLGNQMQAVA